MEGRMMISRRSLIVATTIVPTVEGYVQASPAIPLPIPPNDRIAFRIIRNGDVIGSHTLNFARTGEDVTISIAVDILVKFGPVPVFRYSHRATEHWRGDQFMAIESQSNNDGSPQFMKAERQSAGLVVVGSKTDRYTAPPHVFATTYWNKAALQNQVINSEDGRLFRVNPMQMDEDTVPVGSGSTLRARHFRLSGDLPLDLWYDGSGQWAHMIFTRSNSNIIYEKL